MKKVISIVVTVMIVFSIIYLINYKPVATVQKTEDFETATDALEESVVDIFNSEACKILVKGVDVRNFGYNFYVTKNMKLCVEESFLKEIVSCSIITYNDGRMVVAKGDNILELNQGSDVAIVNDAIELDLVDKVNVIDGVTYIPFDDIASYLAYEVNYSLKDKEILLALNGEEIMLPKSYDLRDYGKISPIRDQGTNGTCWAFASLAAVESTLLPRTEAILSPDHMSRCEIYGTGIVNGGYSTIGIAYLASWLGPVFEKDDPYGDGVTTDGLESEYHLEEAIIIENKDVDVIKGAIFRYGAVESSMYMYQSYTTGTSEYYDAKNHAYYYDGENETNHDILIVGWDDEYSKNNFTKTPDGDGAFICKNSWGENFGDKGYFYISYFDTRVCSKAIVYSKVSDKNNFDKIYQSDLLGWIGQLGFDSDEAYFANVYTAGAGEELDAVSFYATGEDTEFEVYLVQNYKNEDSFANKQFVTSGSMKYSGYYTVRLPEAIRLSDNDRFAVVVKIKSAGNEYPIAVEVASDDHNMQFDISDGEGYISRYGEVWHCVEDTQECNLCLKAFTNKVK